MPGACMIIVMAKNRQCSWTGKTRRELRLASRINAQEWDGLFALANETGTPVKRIVRDAVREYIARHRQQENRSEVCITVRGNDGTQVLQKIKHFFGG